MQLDIQREYFWKISFKDLLRKLFKVLLSHENRIRVLEGKNEITKEQFITALKNL